MPLLRGGTVLPVVRSVTTWYNSYRIVTEARESIAKG